MATTVRHEKGHPPQHRYPTRWSLRRHASFSISVTPKLEARDKKRVIVACKRRKEENNSFSLPREIIFNILLLIPAPVLYEVVRYVCKQCYDVVSDPLFVKAHQQMSSAGFLIQDVVTYQVWYIEAGIPKTLKLTQLEIPFRADIICSSNGLLLLRDLSAHQTFHVLNLVTKEKMALPPLLEFKLHSMETCCAFTSAGHYKVVHVTGLNRSQQSHMRVFTVGIDNAWRSIDLQGISIEAPENGFTLLYQPRYIAGFIYWCLDGCYPGFALDVNSETIYHFPRPNYQLSRPRQVNFLSFGTCLGLFELNTWKLWKLSDVKSGKWTEVVGVGLNMKKARSRFDKMFNSINCTVFVPITVIKEDLWYYRCYGLDYYLVRYNLTTGRFVFCPLPMEYPSSTLYPHVHTLLSPKNCFC